MIIFTDLVKMEISVKKHPEDLVKEILENTPVVDVLAADGDVIRVKAGGRVYNILLLKLAAGYPGHVKKAISESGKMADCYRLVLVPFMSDKTAELCKEAGVGFCDAAGNCQMAFGPVYITVSGKKNLKAQNRASKSVFERSSIVSSRVLRTLVSQPERSWKTEELAEAAGCSLGQIAKIKRFLEDNDWIGIIKKGFKLQKLEDMLSRWAEIYNARPNDVVECYVPGNLAEIESRFEQIREQAGLDYWLTGFSGGNRYSPTVRYSKIHVYVRESAVEKMLQQLDGKRVESGANLAFMIPYDDCVLIDSRTVKESSVVSPLQVYLDCKPLKARGEEMAEGVLRAMKTW